MNSRIWIASAAGVVALFCWIFIAHMALPLREAGIGQIDNRGPWTVHISQGEPRRKRGRLPEEGVVGAFGNHGLPSRTRRQFRCGTRDRVRHGAGIGDGGNVSLNIDAS